MTSTWKGDLLFVTALAALLSVLVLRFFPGLLDGLLVETDGYMRLVRVRQLAASGEWFDGGMIARSNAPYGASLHWTRPVDVLLLLGAWLLTPFLGFEQALHLSGVLFSPLLLVAVCFATAWAVRPLAGAGVRYYTMIAVLAQVGIVGYALPGRPDHHILILLAFVAMIGAVLRLLPGEGGSRWGWAAGAWAAFGLWVSTEFLVAWGVLLGSLTVLWVVQGGYVAARARSVSLGLVAVTSLAVLAEHGPTGLWVAEYDRISVVHLLVAVLAAAFWGGAASLPADRSGPGGRGAFSVAGGLLAGLLVLAVYPAFYGGPMVDVDPELKRTWLPLLTEYQPYLVPRGWADVGRILAYLGHAVLAAGVAVYGIVRVRRRPLLPAWLLLATGLAVFLPLAVRWVRFVPYAEILGVLGSMVLLAGALRSLGGSLSGLRLSLARASTTAALLAGPLLLGAGVMAVGGQAGETVREAGATQVEACPVEALVTTLSDSAGLGDRPRTVLAHVDLGPLLLYRTPHAVVATPYHRNAAGILDVRRMMYADEPEEARRMMGERGIDLVVPCGFPLAPAGGGDGPEPFLSLLRTGPLPDWLVPHPVSDGAGGGRIYEVVPASPEPSPSGGTG